MTERLGATSYPLYWPSGWKRTKHPARARFGDTSVYKETQRVRHELALLRARKVVVSSNLQLRQDGIPYANQRRPEDAGVAVWFELRQDGEWREHVLACDRWDRPEHNLRAIQKHIEALRGQERWGVGSVQQAFRGYQALPENAGGRPWHVVLQVHPDASPEEIRTAYRKRAVECHPDHGGTPESWHELQAAYAEATR